MGNIVGTGSREGVKSAPGTHRAKVNRRSRPGSPHQVPTGQRSAQGQDLGDSTRSTPGKGKRRVEMGNIVGTGSREGVKSAPGTHRAKANRRSRPGSPHQVPTGQRPGQDLGHRGDQVKREGEVSTVSTPGKGQHRVKTGEIVGTGSREGVKSAPGTHRAKVSRGSRHGIGIRSSPGKGQQRVKTWDQHQVLTGQR
jgi:hypothetical protein